MIDGRYRVASACVSFLHAMKYAKDNDYVRKNVRIAFHDATSRENSFGRYGQLQSIATVVGKARELWIYRLKTGITEQDIYDLWKSNTKIQFRHRRKLLETEEGFYSKFDEIRFETYNRATETPDLSSFQNHHMIQNVDLWKKIENIDYNDNVPSNQKVIEHLLNLYTKSSSVFEFGVGKLTDISMITNITRFSGSDSLAQRLSNVRNTTIQSSRDHFRFFFSDIGKTTDDGMALDDKQSKIWYHYVLAPLVGESKPFDIYVIDGRRYGFFCVCVSFLHAIKNKANMKDVVIIVHSEDFGSKMNSLTERIGGSDQENSHFNMYRLLPDRGEKEIITELMNYSKFQ